MVYHVLYRTLLVFHLPVYLFSIKICIGEKGCKINDSIDLDQVRVLRYVRMETGSYRSGEFLGQLNKLATAIR